LTTLLRPDSGTARVGGYDVIKEGQGVRSVFGLAGQYPAVDEGLRGKENLEMIGQLYHLGKPKSQALAAELLAGFGLSDAANRMVKTYSGGMRRRLDLAATLIASPSILFLDEPTAGLDPRSRIGLWEIISAQAKSCKTVFMTTQYLEEADRLADKIAIMDRGKIIREGTPQELKSCCGGATLIKIKLVDRNKTALAQEALKELGKGKITILPDIGELSLPADGGTGMLTDIVRLLDLASIEVAELGLKQPTLDDVFLSITGHAAQEPTEVK
jgi:ABC-2 type transport system ATP-binding protein